MIHDQELLQMQNQVSHNKCQQLSLVPATSQYYGRAHTSTIFAFVDEDAHKTPLAVRAYSVLIIQFS